MILKVEFRRGTNPRCAGDAHRIKGARSETAVWDMTCLLAIDFNEVGRVSLGVRVTRLLLASTFLGGLTMSAEHHLEGRSIPLNSHLVVSYISTAASSITAFHTEAGKPSQPGASSHAVSTTSRAEHLDGGGPHKSG